MTALALAPSESRAGEGEVSAAETIVRSAPFEVAPEIGRVHAGEKVAADDQAQGAWRRVQLPDGRFGFVHDTDVKVTTADVKGTAALLPAPARVDLPDAGTKSAEATGSRNAGAGVEGTTPVVAQRQSAARPAASDPTLLGVMFQLFPVGTLTASRPGNQGRVSLSNDSVFAVGVAPFLDFAASPYLALGLSPQVVFRVKGDGAMGQSSTELDLRARVTGRLPLSQSVRAYGRLSPGYSVIFLPDDPSGSKPLPNPKGFVMDFAVGTEVALLPNMFLAVDLGYQLGFQSSTASDQSSMDGSRFLHLGAGFAVGF